MEKEALEWVIKAKDKNTVVLTVPMGLRAEVVEKLKTARSTALIELVEELKKWVVRPPKCYWACGVLFPGDPDILGQIVNIEKTRLVINKVREFTDLFGLREHVTP